MIRVMTVDDHPLVREGIVGLVNAQPDMEVTGTCSSARKVIDTFAECTPDVLLMDLRLSDGNGIDVMSELLSHDSTAKVILLSMFDGDAEIRRALKMGARAYVLKVPTQRSWWR